MIQRKCPIDPECDFWELEDYTYHCKLVECYQNSQTLAVSETKKKSHRDVTYSTSVSLP